MNNVKNKWEIILRSLPFDFLLKNNILEMYLKTCNFLKMSIT